jgi:hypothetical protein
MRAAKLLARRYAWFGATRNAENLHGVHPFNRLMDDREEVTPLYGIASKLAGFADLPQGLAIYPRWSRLVN